MKREPPLDWPVWGGRTTPLLLSFFNFFFKKKSS
jgi:hypothetical protein